MGRLRGTAGDNGKGNGGLFLAVMDIVRRYGWPGNVRERENVMERAVLLAGRDGLVPPRYLPPDLHSEHCPVRMSARADGLGLTERVMALRRRKYGIRYQDFRPGRK